MFCPFTKNEKELLEKLRENVVGGPSIVFTRKAVVGETPIHDPTNRCKTIDVIDASHLYPYSMCQAMPTGLWKRWKLESEYGKFKPRQNKTGSLEIMVMSYFQRFRPQCKVENFYTTGK